MADDFLDTLGELILNLNSLRNGALHSRALHSDLNYIIRNGTSEEVGAVSRHWDSQFCTWEASAIAKIAARIRSR